MGGQNAPNPVTVCVLREGSSFEQEATGTRVLRVLLFSSQWGLDGYQKRRQHPRLSRVWLRKYQSPDPANLSMQANGTALRVVG